MDIIAFIGNGLLALCVVLAIDFLGFAAYIALNWAEWSSLKTKADYDAITQRAARWYFSIPAMLAR